jgi:hypothetical protein
MVVNGSSLPVLLLTKVNGLDIGGVRQVIVR